MVLVTPFVFLCPFHCNATTNTDVYYVCTMYVCMQVGWLVGGESRRLITLAVEARATCKS